MERWQSNPVEALAAPTPVPVEPATGQTEPESGQPHAYADKFVTALRGRAGRVALCAFLSVNGLMPEASVANNDAQNFPPAPAASQEPGGNSQGAWITNAVSGYYLGRMLPGDKVYPIAGGNHPKDYTYALVRHKNGNRNIDQCGWIASVAIPASMLKAKRHAKDHSRQIPGTQHCKEIRSNLLNRYSFGIEFNCLPHECVDGTSATPLTTDCDYKVYYNYAPRFKAVAARRARAHTDNGFYDYAGTVSSKDLIHYRFTTFDKEAEVIRTKNFNWVYMERSCTVGNPQGGKPKLAQASSAASPLPVKLSVPLAKTPKAGQLNF